MLPVAGALVLMLYILLFHEIITYINSRNEKQVDNDKDKGDKAVGIRLHRPSHSSAAMATKSLRSLDQLWVRMKHASSNIEMNERSSAIIGMHMESTNHSKSTFADATRPAVND